MEQPIRTSAKRREPKVRVNLSLCRYEVVRKIVRDRGWIAITDENDSAAIASCNLHWIDVTEFVPLFRIIQPYMRINHFPGMSNLARKSRLARNYERMKKLFPEEYDFCPRTWILPTDLHDFQQQFNSEGVSNRTFIIKPDGACQGRGVFLTRNLDRVDASKISVAQQYIAKPLLIDGKKFDLRIYVLCTACDPLRVYLFQDGLVRMCSEAYVAPNGSNMNQRFIHLTNYAVNKHSNNKQQDEEGGGIKRSLRWFLTWLRELYGDEKVDALWESIGDIILKSILTVQPMLAQDYRSTFARYVRNNKVSVTPTGSPPATWESSRPASADGAAKSSSSSTSPKDSCSCFSLLGMDVLLDEQLKPWMLEVNHLPSFGCDTPLDWDVKERLISQTLDILDLKGTDRGKFEAAQTKSTQERLYGRHLKGNQRTHARDDSSFLPVLTNVHPPNQQQDSDNEKSEARPEQPSPVALDLSEDELRSTLLHYYAAVKPGRKQNIDKLIEKYLHNQAALDRHFRKKYHRSLQSFIMPSKVPLPQPVCEVEDDFLDEELIDFELLYPPRANPSKAKLYKELIEASKKDTIEQQLRFTMPLQHRKVDTSDVNTLPLISTSQNVQQQVGRDCYGYLGTDKARLFASGNQSSKLYAAPDPEQVAAAHRLMLGHSSQTQNINLPTPIAPAPRESKNALEYGRQYRERLLARKSKPTVALTPVTLNVGGMMFHNNNL